MLVDAAKHHYDNAKVQARVAGALRKLSANDENKHEIAETGGIPMLIHSAKVRVRVRVRVTLPYAHPLGQGAPNPNPNPSSCPIPNPSLTLSLTLSRCTWTTPSCRRGWRVHSPTCRSTTRSSNSSPRRSSRVKG